jgi:hypothetical protein
MKTGEMALRQQQEDPKIRKTILQLASNLSDEDIDMAKQGQPLSRFPRGGNRDIRPQYYEKEIG